MDADNLDITFLADGGAGAGGSKRCSLLVTLGRKPETLWKARTTVFRAPTKDILIYIHAYTYIHTLILILTSMLVYTHVHTHSISTNTTRAARQHGVKPENIYVPRLIFANTRV